MNRNRNPNDPHLLSIGYFHNTNGNLRGRCKASSLPWNTNKQTSSHPSYSGLRGQRMHVCGLLFHWNGKQHTP